MGWWSRSSPQERWKKIERQRTEALKHPGLSPALAALLSHPVPEANTPAELASFLSFDFETNGLDIGQHQILSVGAVRMTEMRIALNTCWHHYIAGSQTILASSVVINQITPEILISGESMDRVMETLFAGLVGAVALVHGRMVEERFILQYIEMRYGLKLSFFPVVWVDTLTLAKQQFHGERHPDLRLAKVRQQLGLPDYPAHNALTDAVATAELLLALIKDRKRLHQVA